MAQELPGSMTSEHGGREGGLTKWIVWGDPVLLTEGVCIWRVCVVQHQHPPNDPVDVSWRKENAVACEARVGSSVSRPICTAMTASSAACLQKISLKFAVDLASAKLSCRGQAAGTESSINSSRLVLLEMTARAIEAWVAAEQLAFSIAYPPIFRCPDVPPQALAAQMSVHGGTNINRTMYQLLQHFADISTCSCKELPTIVCLPGPPR